MFPVFRFLVFGSMLAMMGISLAVANEEDAKKAQEEIQNTSKEWVVEWSYGTIQYKLHMKLTGSPDNIIGNLSGEGVVQVKERKVRIFVQMQLTGGKYHYITRYPAMTFTYIGRMTSSDPQVFPIRETVHFQDSLLLKEGKLCPLSIRQNPQCMVPEKN